MPTTSIPPTATVSIPTPAPILGQPETTSYDTDANEPESLAKYIDPNNDETDYAVALTGQMLAEFLPDGTTQTWDRDDIGRTTVYTDQAGDETTYTNTAPRSPTRP